MCTVTFLPRSAGYALAMNRDEARSRPSAHPPSTRSFHKGHAVYPSEPGGGTWIALNDQGTTFALINWYSKPPLDTDRTVSRGEVVVSILKANSPSQVGQILDEFGLRPVKPFRLIGVFAQLKRVVEWRWDMEQLETLQHSWSANQWASSGFDEPAAQQSRRIQFLESIQRPSAGSTRWLRQFHRSHVPHPGPLSVCMHREDASTVSYTEVIVSRRLAHMRYAPGPPCCTPIGNTLGLTLQFSLE